MANGVVIWEGPSAIDGAPLVVIATGIKAASRNAKTGSLIQTWILRADIAPHDAIKTGEDSSICGDCPHRGVVVDGKNEKRSCYVITHQAPLSAWRCYQRGGYAKLDLDAARALFAGRNVRLGAYGDPAAVPFDVWESVLADSARGTGYTHQWHKADSRFARYCMASADSAEQAAAAQAMGYRTFRVGTAAEKVARGEFLCPASAEAGKKLSCADCLACGGTRAPNKASVFIPAHGPAPMVKAFEERACA